MEPDFSEFKTYYIKLLFKNDPQWHIYRIPFTDYGRIRDALAGETDLSEIANKDLIQFVAYGDLRVLFRLSFLQAVQFIWEPIKGRPDEEPEEYEQIRIFLTGQPEPLEVGTDTDSEIFTFYCMFMDFPHPPGGFVGFPDEDGEEIYIKRDEVYILEIPDYMIEESAHPDDEEFDDDDDNIDDITPEKGIPGVSGDPEGNPESSDEDRVF